MRYALAGLALAAGTLGVLTLPAEAQKLRKPHVVGDWKGTWGIYSPPAPGQPAPKPDPLQQIQLDLECKVVELSPGKWEATFQGQAGGPYKYTVRMQGRQAGQVVLFNGTADLGEKDGGVYDWIGRATDSEFVGFYTSQKYTGTFRMARPK